MTRKSSFDASSLAEVVGIEIVRYAGNGLDTVEGIRKAKPDVVNLDIRVPGGSGIGVLERLKEDPSVLERAGWLGGLFDPRYSPGGGRMRAFI
jgi:DNA-binding NarL/FixJ family response regulator